MIAIFLVSYRSFPQTCVFTNQACCNYTTGRQTLITLEPIMVIQVRVNVRTDVSTLITRLLVLSYTICWIRLFNFCRVNYQKTWIVKLVSSLLYNRWFRKDSARVTCRKERIFELVRLMWTDYGVRAYRCRRGLRDTTTHYFTTIKCKDINKISHNEMNLNVSLKQQQYVFLQQHAEVKKLVAGKRRAR